MIIIYGELYSSKNSRNTVKVGKRLIPLKSKNAKSQEKDFALQLSVLRMKFLKETRGAVLPLKLQFKIYRRTHGKFDYVNIVQGLLDAMVRARLIHDDDANHVIPSFAPYEKDQANPRTEITVL